MCAGSNEQFGVIEFAIAARVSTAFKRAVNEVEEKHWHPIYKEESEGHKIKTEQEWSEVCFVPDFAVKSKPSVEYRYIGIRERMSVQKELPGIEPVTREETLPFQTLDINSAKYKLFGIVTNRTLPGNELIN